MPDPAERSSAPRIQPMDPGDDFIETTRAFWSKRLGRPVSREEARTLIREHTDAFLLLAKARPTGS